MSDNSPWLVVGLGNPGPRYAANRHNIGFESADRWLANQPVYSPSWSEKWKAKLCSVSLPVGRCVVIKPQTFMNRSGESVVAAMNFFRTELSRMIVLHDELDFEFGRIAIKNGGGHGGHNGLRDIVKHLGDPGFIRIRIGIGRPSHGQVSNWVLSDFTQEESQELDDILQRSSSAISSIMVDGLSAAMNKFNIAPEGAKH